jgi:hypothetical protein
MKHQVLTIFALFALLASSALAQQSSELDKLDEKLVHHFEKAMPEWKHERVEPIAGSVGVLIQFWSFGDRKVKVSILLHKSVAEARATIQTHVRYSFNSETLTGIGDEAYSSSVHTSFDVTFRRGKITVNIFAPADLGVGPDGQPPTPERLELEKAEMKQLSRELAKQVVAGIDAP